MSLLIKLLLAHLLGDFVLQPTLWVEDKRRKKLKSPYLYAHTAIHFLLIILLTQSWEMWELALIIAVLHLIIDTLKLYLTERVVQRSWPFFVDQLLHVAVLIGAVVLLKNQPLDFEKIGTFLDIKVVIAYVFITTPAGVIIDKCLSSWQVDEKDNASLPKAGKIIGIIERLLVLTFILLHHWEAIGFLITAKSVFRFNDLKVADRKLTEYILIGTLLSFGIAIFTGILLNLSLIY